MKVSEAIDRLKVGDTVWVKSKVTAINSENTKTSIYLDGDEEISLTEPQVENVEVPEFVAEWYESNKYKLERAIIDVACSMEKGEFPYNLPFEDWFIDPENHPIETLISMMKDGYTIKPKRWVVKVNGRTLKHLQFYKYGTPDPLLTPFFENGSPMVFTNKVKAEAVATLVDGSVEEI